MGNPLGNVPVGPSSATFETGRSFLVGAHNTAVVGIVVLSSATDDTNYPTTKLRAGTILKASGSYYIPFAGSGTALGILMEDVNLLKSDGALHSTPAAMLIGGFVWKASCFTGGDGGTPWVDLAAPANGCNIVGR